MQMASFFIKIRHFFGDTSLTERSIGAGPPVIIQLSDSNTLVTLRSESSIREPPEAIIRHLCLSIFAIFRAKTPLIFVEYTND